MIVFIKFFTTKYVDWYYKYLMNIYIHTNWVSQNPTFPMNTTIYKLINIQFNKRRISNVMIDVAFVLDLFFTRWSKIKVKYEGCSSFSIKIIARYCVWAYNDNEIITKVIFKQMVRSIWIIIPDLRIKGVLKPVHKIRSLFIWYEVRNVKFT